MPYADHFRLTDDLIVHLDTTVGASGNAFIEARYTGFLAVSAVTVYELAIKTIFQEFAERKHRILANFTSVYFDRINGRIRVNAIKSDYLKKYGPEYVDAFALKLDEVEKAFLKSDAVSTTTSYENVITWRNEFAHEGRVPSTATYGEVKAAYSHGKRVIECLAHAMA